jgi:hypothetical protein
MKDNILILYTGPLCHLCAEARRTVLAQLPSGIRLQEVDITSNEALFKKYSTAIPVLAVVDGEGAIEFEKHWPFSPGQVKRAVAEFIL